MINLKKLDLGGTKVDGELGGLAPLTRLEFLALNGCSGVMGDIGGVAPLIKLVTLDLGGEKNKVEGDVCRLAPLTNLTKLHLGSCKEVGGDIAGMKELVLLKELQLAGTKVFGNVSGIASLTNLVILNLSGVYSPDQRNEVTGDVSGQ